MKLGAEEMTNYCRHAANPILPKSQPPALLHGSRGGLGTETHDVFRVEVVLPFMMNAGYASFHLVQYQQSCV